MEEEQLWLKLGDVAAKLAGDAPRPEMQSKKPLARETRKPAKGRLTIAAARWGNRPVVRRRD